MTSKSSTRVTKDQMKKRQTSSARLPTSNFQNNSAFELQDIQDAVGNHTINSMLEEQKQHGIDSITPQSLTQTQHESPKEDVVGRIHDMLDAAGLVPALGIFPDALNAGLYVIEGDWLNAGLSALAMVEVIGQGAILTKQGVKISRKTIQEASEQKLLVNVRNLKIAKKQTNKLDKRNRPRLQTGKYTTKWPESRLNTWVEPIHGENNKMHQQILDSAGKSRQSAQHAGRQYQKLVAKDLNAEDVQEMFRRDGRRMDIGVSHEVTIEGGSKSFGSRKLDQLWLDLHDLGKVLLTVPKLSDGAKDQLLRLGAQAEKEFSKEVMIFVRQTQP